MSAGEERGNRNHEHPDIGPSYGLFLNLGKNLGATTEAVFEHTIEQTMLAERLGFREVWVTEHHFIPFGVNPSALTAAAFLLGHTKRIRVGTACVLAPLQRPVAIAEQAALLDQLSSGRFDLGIGRGGYLKDYEVLGIEIGRWDEEPITTARAALEAWTGVDLAREDHTTGPSPLEPAVRSRPHPPLFLASSSPETVAFAAEHRLPLQHYFA
ncbi:MAG: LLM class flavin-dependent oxidoreductase, partial [Acidimicrobiales bacterium]